MVPIVWKDDHTPHLNFISTVSNPVTETVLHLQLFFRGYYHPSAVIMFFQVDCLMDAGPQLAVIKHEVCFGTLADTMEALLSRVQVVYSYKT